MSFDAATQLWITTAKANAQTRKPSLGQLDFASAADFARFVDTFDSDGLVVVATADALPGKRLVMVLAPGAVNPEPAKLAEFLQIAKNIPEGGVLSYTRLFLGTVAETDRTFAALREIFGTRLLTSERAELPDGKLTQVATVMNGTMANALKPSK